MKIDKFSLKKYERLENKIIELEKNYKLLQIESERDKSQLKEIVDFLKKGRPYDTGDDYGYLSMAYWLNGDQREKAMGLFKKHGISLKKEDN